MFYRKIEPYIEDCLTSTPNKTLFIDGAKQVDKTFIKLYYSDVGLLTNLLYKNNINAILSSDNSVNLGFIYETVVAQELRTTFANLYYYDRRKVGEVNFLINDYDNLSVLPIEIRFKQV